MEVAQNKVKVRTVHPQNSATQFMNAADIEIVDIL